MDSREEAVSEKLPWFPMYPADFVTSRKVGRMTAEQVGIYTLLLCEQWMGGPLADDTAELARIGKTNQKKAFTVVEMCFKLTAKGWVNPRLKQVLREQTQKKRKASRDAKKAADARWEKEREKRDADAMRSHSGRMPIRTEKNRAEEKRKETTTTSDDGFQEFWKAYPKRAGSNPKAKALTRWLSNRKRSIGSTEMIAGALRYARFLKATGKIGTEYVQQAVTFLGQNEGWTEDWTVTESDRAKVEEVHPSVEFNRKWKAREDAMESEDDGALEQVGGLTKEIMRRISA